MSKSSQSYCRNFQNPEETRQFKAHGRLEILNFRDGSTIGRGTFEPGWKWSNDVKPIAGTESCQSDHHGYCIAGSMVIRMDNGEEFRIRAGDAFSIPPGHDAWVDSNESCVMIDVTGFKTYAVKKAA